MGNLASSGSMGKLSIRNTHIALSNDRLAIKNSTIPKANAANLLTNTSKNNFAKQTGTGSLYDRFAAEISNRCQKSLPPSSEPEKQNTASMLADSLVHTAHEIKSRFGQDKANEFMSKILSATDANVTEKGLSSAISGFFQNLQRDSNISGTDLEKMRSGLNRGVAASDEAILSGDGLASVLNSVFGNHEAKAFDANFDRVVLSATSSDSAEGGAITYNMEEAFANTALSSSSVSTKVAEFLRQEVGNENAAAYMESLGLDDNYLVGLATVCGAVANENGQEAAQKFVSFLNSEIKGYLSDSQDDVSVLSIHLGADYSNEETRKTSGFNWGQKGTLVENHSLYEAENPSGNNPPPDTPTATLITLDMFEKGHQGLTIMLDGKAGNTGGSGFVLDISALYQAYLAKSPSVATPTFANPKANLVDKVA